MLNFPGIIFFQVLVSLALYLNVCKLFHCVGNPVRQRGSVSKHFKIDYDDLAQGALTELRHVFSMVVFDAIYPLDLDEESGG